MIIDYHRLFLFLDIISFVQYQQTNTLFFYMFTKVVIAPVKSMFSRFKNIAQKCFKPRFYKALRGGVHTPSNTPKTDFPVL